MDVAGSRNVRMKGVRETTLKYDGTAKKTKTTKELEIKKMPQDL